MYEPDYDENGMLIFTERQPLGGLEPDCHGKHVTEDNKLEEIYLLLGYENMFSIKSEDVKNYSLKKAHNTLLDILSKCQDLEIITSINEERLNQIENKLKTDGD